MQTISIVMVGQLPFPPYQSVYWTVYGEPDNTGLILDMEPTIY